jgi:hypothetical protein
MSIDVAAISIIDRLIQLLTTRERNREKYFNNLIEPLYRDAEVVARDYMALFAEFVQRLQTAATSKELILWLEQRRAAYQPVRMKIRALLADEALQKLSEKKSTAARTRFAKGLWGLLKGTFLLGQDDDEGTYAYLREYGYGDHAILPILQYMRGSHPARDLDETRGSLVRFAQRQQVAIESAWSDVVGAYAELKRHSL